MAVALLLCEDHPKWAHFSSRCEALLGVAIDVFECYDRRLPCIDDYDAYLVSGSHYGVSDDLPWMHGLAAFMRAVEARPEKRLVAICFGHQLMAHAFGGRVTAMPRFSFGVDSLQCTSHAWSLLGIPRGATVTLLKSHGDAVEHYGTSVPLRVLATSETSKYEVVLVGTHWNMMGVQGHPELLADDLRDCIAPALAARNVDVSNGLGCIDSTTAQDAHMKGAIRRFLVGESRFGPTASTIVSYVAYTGHLAFFQMEAGAPSLDLVGLVASTSAMALVYIADRSIVQEEDASADHAHLRHARSRHLWPTVCAATLAWSTCAYLRPIVLLRAICASALCIWYAVPIPGVGRRLKCLFPGSKNMFVGAVHAYWTYACFDTQPAPGSVLWFLAGIGPTMSTSFMDVKDVLGDRRAGVVTLPTVLGPRRALQTLAAVYHILACVAGATGYVVFAATYAMHTLAMLWFASRRQTPTLLFVCASWSVPLALRVLLS